MKFTNEGRVAIAKMLFESKLFLLVGSGSPAWGSSPEQPGDDIVGLEAPVAVIRPRITSFGEPDPAGAIETDDGVRFRQVESPTRYLINIFTIGFDEGANDVYREYALISAPVFDESVLPGERYIPYWKVKEDGAAIFTERFGAISRSGLKLDVTRVCKV